MQRRIFSDAYAKQLRAGSYVTLHSELLTSIMEGVKIKVVVFDNG